jgi:hypothetical protein
MIHDNTYDLDNMGFKHGNFNGNDQFDVAFVDGVIILLPLISFCSCYCNDSIVMLCFGWENYRLWDCTSPRRDLGDLRVAICIMASRHV